MPWICRSKFPILKAQRVYDLMISKETLLELFIEKKMTDTEIANLYKVDRTHIVHQRKAFGITKDSLRDQAIPIIGQKLISQGYKVKYMKEDNKTKNIDFLVDEDIKIKVMISKGLNDGRYMFALTTQERHKNIESDYRVQLTNGRFRILYSKVCDFIIFVGIRYDKYHYWIIPAEDLGDKLQTVAVSNSPQNRFFKYYANWNLIKSRLQS